MTADCGHACHVAHIDPVTGATRCPRCQTEHQSAEGERADERYYEAYHGGAGIQGCYGDWPRKIR